MALLERDYRERSMLLGRRVRLLHGERPIEGVVLDLSARGGLLLRGDSGLPVHLRAEHVGEVRLL
jgi:biotin-(acetyl-CoA carboxylase) ligase